MLTKTQAIREALKTVEDPNAADTKRFLAIARAKLHQSGDTKTKITLNNIHQARSKLRIRLGDLTRQKILDYEATMRVVRPSANGVQKPAPVVTMAQEVSVTLTQLRQAKDFARLAGGIEKAIALLQDLKEVLS